MSRILRSIAKDVKKNQQLEFQPRLLAITATKVGWTQIGELLGESPRFRDFKNLVLRFVLSRCRTTGHGESVSSEEFGDGGRLEEVQERFRRVLLL